MKLSFKLLVVDDNPETVGQAVGALRDWLAERGFSLEVINADDLSPGGLRTLARKSGKDLDLVIIDFNLGGAGASDGAAAAKRFRQQLTYTDIIFYSSDPAANLLAALAKEAVAGVFVARRDDNLDEALTGIADTIIGRAVDIVHMRGIAMSEVAELDVLLEETLLHLLESVPDVMKGDARKYFMDMLKAVSRKPGELEPLIAAEQYVEIVSDHRFFTSANRYRLVREFAKRLPNRPANALEELRDFQEKILDNRNTLAHAKEEERNGVITLRAARRGQKPITIDDEWMKTFRLGLQSHGRALAEVCGELSKFVRDSQGDGKGA